MTRHTLPPDICDALQMLADAAGERAYYALFPNGEYLLTNVPAMTDGYAQLWTFPPSEKKKPPRGFGS